jgi:hypothetical protein
VDGQPYISALQEIAGGANIMGSLGSKVLVHYNPKRPSQSYYAPACQLASRLLVGLAIVAAIAAIGVSVHIHKPQ